MGNRVEQFAHHDSFEEFSRQPEYQTVTHDYIYKTLSPLIATWLEDGSQRVRKIGVIGSGNGLGVDLMRDLLNFHEIPSQIVCIDINEPRVRSVKEKIPSYGTAHVLSVIGDATELPFGNELFDAEYLLNWLHEVQGKDEKEALENKRKVVKGAADALAPGGKQFTFGAFVKDKWFPANGDGMKWGGLKLYSMIKLGKRDKTHPGFIEHSLEDYYSLGESSGLVRVENEFSTESVPLTSTSLRAIAKYDGWIRGFFADLVDSDLFTLEQKTKAMIQTIDEMERKLREKTENPRAILTLSRNWVGHTLQKAA